MLVNRNRRRGWRGAQWQGRRGFVRIVKVNTHRNKIAFPLFITFRVETLVNPLPCSSDATHTPHWDLENVGQSMYSVSDPSKLMRGGQRLWSFSPEHMGFMEKDFSVCPSIWEPESFGILRWHAIHDRHLLFHGANAPNLSCF